MFATVNAELKFDRLRTTENPGRVKGNEETSSRSRARGHMAHAGHHESTSFRETFPESIQQWSPAPQRRSLFGCSEHVKSTTKTCLPQVRCALCPCGARLVVFCLCNFLFMFVKCFAPCPRPTLTSQLLPKPAALHSLASARFRRPFACRCCPHRRSSASPPAWLLCG